GGPSRVRKPRGLRSRRLCEWGNDPAEQHCPWSCAFAEAGVRIVSGTASGSNRAGPPCQWKTPVPVRALDGTRRRNRPGTLEKPVPGLTRISGGHASAAGLPRLGNHLAQNPGRKDSRGNYSLLQEHRTRRPCGFRLLADKDRARQKPSARRVPKEDSELFVEPEFWSEIGVCAIQSMRTSKEFDE